MNSTEIKKALSELMDHAAKLGFTIIRQDVCTNVNTQTTPDGRFYYIVGGNHWTAKFNLTAEVTP